MRLSFSKSKNATSLYAIKDVTIDGKRTTKIVEKLGTLEELNQKLDGADPIEWAKKYIDQLNQKEKVRQKDVLLKYSPTKLIEKNHQVFYNGGYLFLQKIYYELGLHQICKEISSKYKFTFDLNSILSRLVYGRIIFPASKLATHQLASKFIEPPNFELQHIYRALEVLAKESDYIQSALYKNSLKMTKRNTNILYYDCTNYFFEIEQEAGLKQYGFSKEHRPNPIVQMGLFMDGDGIPLAFNINRGNTNEQRTLKPLEKQILSDFELSRFVVCTDAGLSSNENRQFNTMGGRAFVTTQSIKKLKKHLKEWALNPTGWRLSGEDTLYDLTEIDTLLENTTDEKEKSKWHSKIFYKERWINENDLEQKIIVTFSFKYRDYHRSIRASQIERAQKKIDKEPSRIGKANQNDYKRFIQTESYTKEGEKASKKQHRVNETVIAREEIYDGFYGVCTNIDDDTSSIIKINKQRWMIEEAFRIMKSEFKARPVYLSRDDRIRAHFTTCFISLMLYKLLKKKLSDQHTCNEIIDCLKEMNFYEVRGEGYIPTYARTDLTDDLHDSFEFRTDYQIVTQKEMNKILKQTKK